jgi:hypothetical protein
MLAKDMGERFTLAAVANHRWLAGTPVRSADLSTSPLVGVDFNPATVERLSEIYQVPEGEIVETITSNPNSKLAIAYRICITNSESEIMAARVPAFSRKRAFSDLLRRPATTRDRAPRTTPEKPVQPGALDRIAENKSVSNLGTTIRFRGARGALGILNAKTGVTKPRRQTFSEEFH